MTNTILVLKDMYGDEIRVNVENIGTYKAHGFFTSLTTKSGELLNLHMTPEELDQMLTESFFMVKKYYEKSEKI